MNTINLQLLKEQKQTLLTIMDYCGSLMNGLPEIYMEHLEGILELLDNIQDGLEDNKLFEATV